MPVIQCDIRRGRPEEKTRQLAAGAAVFTTFIESSNLGVMPGIHALACALKAVLVTSPLFLLALGSTCCFCKRWTGLQNIE